MVTLRPYQQVLVDNCRNAMRRGDRRLMVCSPTGSGKTGIASYMLSEAAQRGNRCAFLVHRIELIRQTMATFRSFGVDAGVIAAGFPEAPDNHLQIASIPTLRRRLKTAGKFDMIVCDEAAHAPSATWREVLNAWPEAWRIGLSATPVRLSGEGFDDLFDRLIAGPTVADLIRDGWLAPFRLFAPPGADPSGLHVRAGDYVPAEAAELVDKPTITGAVVEHYQRLSGGRRAIVFCAGVEHSKHVAEQFNAAGIPARHVDGTTPPEEREQALADFRAGSVRALTNCNLFVEGVDVPALETCIILRPTRSLSMYLQMVGRALRPAEGKTALILDHVSAVSMHGFPDAPHDWSLIGSTTRRRAANGNEPDVKIRVCCECFACYAPTQPACPYCGAAYKPTAKEIAQREGELAEIERIASQKSARVEQGRARTMAELISIGKARGYKNPHFWATKVLSGRKKAA